MQIDIIPALSDNYIYWVQAGHEAAVVDPGEAAPVLEKCEASGIPLTMILVTHHHYDHVNGVTEVKKQTGATVIGPDDPRIPAVDRAVKEGDRIPFAETAFEVWETPGHGDRDISYVLRRSGAPDALFCGDTLFVSGCGRVLQGTADALWASLQAVSMLPDDTEVYCGHEYTIDNLHFACAMHPEDARYRARLADTARRLGEGGYSVPSHIGEEKQANPFLRCPSLKAFKALRAEKDRYG